MPFSCCVKNDYEMLKWLEMDCPCWIIWLCVVDIYLVIMWSERYLLLMLCLHLRWPEGQMLYLDLSIIDVRLLCCSVNHIARWCYFDMTLCFMMIAGYLVFGHISDCVIWWIQCYGYLLHSCIVMLYANVSDVNRLF